MAQFVPSSFACLSVSNLFASQCLHSVLVKKILRRFSFIFATAIVLTSSLRPPPSDEGSPVSIHTTRFVGSSMTFGHS